LRSRRETSPFNCSRLVVSRRGLFVFERYAAVESAVRDAESDRATDQNSGSDGNPDSCADGNSDPSAKRDTDDGAHGNTDARLGCHHRIRAPERSG
jgi:hypothetical protein